MDIATQVNDLPLCDGWIWGLIKVLTLTCQHWLIQQTPPSMSYTFTSKMQAVALTGLLALSASFMTAAQAQTTLRVTTIPEEAATEQVRKFTPLANYLEKQLGMKVQFTPVTDYPAAVESLVNKKVDVVWFGGFTFVQASIRSGGKIMPLAQREEDTKFQSVFIAKTNSGIKTLADMKGKQVSFGSQSSTSGHLMPRSFLLQASMPPSPRWSAARSTLRPWTLRSGKSSWPKTRSTHKT
jgi:phosphonate transport system substrate-binding protein